MKNLVMIGAGNVHMQVLKSLAALPLPGVEVTLVASYPRYICPSLLLGFVAGHWPLAECAVALAPLLDASGVQWLSRSVVELDPKARRLVFDDGSSLQYDVLSVDSGPIQDRQTIEHWMPGAREHALFVRPEEVFCSLWPQVVTLAQSRALRVTIIGQGIGDADLALAVAHRLPRSSVTLLTGTSQLGAKYPPKFQKRVLHALKQRQITVISERCIGVAEGEITLSNGARLACDVPIVAIGTSAPAWLLTSGISIDEQGSVLVDAYLRSTTHSDVFVAGKDGCEANTSSAGSSLAINLRAILAGIQPKPWVQKSNLLTVLSCGDRSAIAVWGNTCVQGRCLGWLKDWLEQRSIKQLRRPQRGHRL
jgi:NADH dehydrogenase FAD-containing subunit